MTKRANVLTVSLIAIFAATGVRAEIASKAYVDQQVDSVEDKVDTHIADSVAHITAAERTAWTGKQDAVPAGTSGNIVTYSGTEGTFGSKTFVNTAVYSPEAEEINAVAIPSVALVEEIAAYAAGDYVPLNQSTAQNTHANQVMITDNNGQVVPGQIATGMIANNAVTNEKLSSAVNTSLGKADSAVQSVVTGDSGVGTIKVDGTSVTVHGLGTAAGADVSTNGVGANETGLVTGQQVQAAITGLDLGGTYQAQSTADLQVGTTGGVFRDMTTAEKAALASGIDSSKVAKITANENAITTLNGDATTTGSVAKKISDAITALDLANTYDAKGAAAAAQTAAAADATSKANAAEAAAKSYADGLASNYATAAQGAKADTAVQPGDITDMQIKSNLITDLDANKTATDKYPSAKTVYDAVEAAKTAASGAYQPKSTADRQIGTTGGLWRALTADEAAALDSGITTAKVSGYDSTKSAVENATTGLAATKAIADSAKTTAEAALPAATYNTQVGTVSAANMGTTATTVVGAIKEVHDSVAALDSTYATDSDLTSGLALKQDKTDSTATAGNYIAAGTGVGANLGALDSQLKTTTDTANAAIPKPQGTCTDCVLHFNGTAYAWEEVGR